MLNGALTLFPIVSSNGLIALYCSHVAFIIWRNRTTLPLCAGYPPSLMLHLLSFPPSLGLHLFDLQLLLVLFFGLTGSPSRESEVILSYIVTRQYCDGVPEGNLSDLTVLSFPSTEEASVCLAEPDNCIFYFQNGTKFKP